MKIPHKFRHCSALSVQRQPHSRVLREKPRLRFFMAAREPAMVSRIFSPAAAALDLADAPPPPPNLRPRTDKNDRLHDSRLLTCMGLRIRMNVESIVCIVSTDILSSHQALETL